MPAPRVIQRSGGILTGRDGGPVVPLELSLAVTTTRQFFAVNSNHFANPVLGEGTHFFGATLGNIRTGHAAQIILTPEAAPAPRAAQRIKSGYITITKLPVVIPGTHFSCAIDRIANPVLFKTT